jgi:dTDP-glucose 4,6-dehydratase
LKGEKIIKLGDLAPTRDLNFVNDTVHGFIKAAETDASIGTVIHLGTGVEISVGDLAKKIASLIGEEISIESAKERIRPKKSEVERLLADNSKAQQILNWKPEWSLEKGLTKTIGWFSKEDRQSFYKPDIYNI